MKNFSRGLLTLCCCVLFSAVTAAPDQTLTLIKSTCQDHTNGPEKYCLWKNSSTGCTFAETAYYDHRYLCYGTSCVVACGVPAGCSTTICCVENITINDACNPMTASEADSESTTCFGLPSRH